MCLKSFLQNFVWKEFLLFLDCFYLQKMISWEMCLKSFLDKFVWKEFLLFLDCFHLQRMISQNMCLKSVLQKLVCTEFLIFLDCFHCDKCTLSIYCMHLCERHLFKQTNKRHLCKSDNSCPRVQCPYCQYTGRHTKLMWQNAFCANEIDA